MTIEGRILDRLNELLGQAGTLKQGNEHGQVRSEEHRQSCASWLASAINLIELMCKDPSAIYRTQAHRVIEGGVHLCANDQVGEIAGVLTALAKDAHAGLLASISDQARAETFDDFLDHASAYLDDGRKKEAGVIAGVVFEDSLRRISRRTLEIDDKGEKLDTLISKLAAKGELTAVKAKRARAAAHVRTKATHAQWDEFEAEDVQAAIEFTRELIESKLDG